MKWLSPNWWKYVFSRPLGDNPLKRIICRMRGHPNGPIFYNVNGIEPNGKCIDCDEEIV